LCLVRLGALGGLPRRFHLVQRGLLQRQPRSRELRFHRGEPADELAVGTAKGGLGVDVEFAGEVGDHKQHVADFVLDRVAVATIDGRVHFARFLVQLVEHGRRGGPVEADLCHPAADRPGSRQGRLGERDAVEQRGRGGVASSLLLRLDRIPLVLHLFGRQGCRVGKDVRVAPDQLRAYRFERGRHAEAAAVLADLGEEHPFEDEVTDLFTQVVGVFAFDGVHDFGGLL